MVARFSQMPTLGELTEAAGRLGWTLRRTPGVRSPRGLARIRYLKRGEELVDLPDLRDSDRLTRTTVEHLCRRTGIPLDEFGLTDNN